MATAVCPGVRGGFAVCNVVGGKGRAIGGIWRLGRGLGCQEYVRGRNKGMRRGYCEDCQRDKGRRETVCGEQISS